MATVHQLHPATPPPAAPPPTTTLAEGSQQGRWGFLTKRDRKAHQWEIEAWAKQREAEGTDLFALCFHMLSEVGTRPLMRSRFQIFFNTWVGWGLTQDMILAACVIGQKQAARSPLGLAHKVAEGIKVKLGG